MLKVRGIALFLLSAGLLVWKRKFSKNLFLLVVIFGSLGFTLSASAEQLTLPHQKIEVLPKGNHYVNNELALDGYEYVGYLHDSSDYVPGSKESTVTVKYQDIDGNLLAEDTTLTGTVGETYSAEQRTIEGYTFKEVQGNPTGSFTKENQTVIFLYDKAIQKGTVVVKYQDVDGNLLAEDMTLTGTIGETYSAEQRTIEGYTFKEVQGNPTGSFTKENQTVIFLYEKATQTGTVTVKYQDMDGNPIISDQSITDTIGNPYNFEIKVFEGYNFKEIVGEASGTISNETKIVIMKYVKLSKISISIDVPESNDLIGTEKWYQSLHHPIYIEDENGVMDSNGLKYKGPYTISGFYAPINESDDTIGPKLELTDSNFFGVPNDTYTMPDSFPYPTIQSEFSKYLGVIYTDENGNEKRSSMFSYKNEDIGSSDEGMVISSYRVTYYGSVPIIPSQFENYDQNIVYTLFATYP